ncbi:restriction endonuclease subunit S [Methylophilus sp. YYY-1]|uniref:restriction endonuclease subunit S n=1 Tax=Methylophilus sp. YYY-1 TaxID=2682087 RepID=UPI0023B318FA|nr:restriction endonuclease subunit S [Methylophilus sp. YYY-1]MDF0377472.1 restriction endonuclease subunit S [Methylophilus sp. YYY-1]
MTNIKNLLTEHMAIWTAADTEKKSGRGRASSNGNSVYGVKKLRELILELAVRGKLVSQDPNDEPASELLKRIQAEKAKLIAEGKLKKEKPLAPIGQDEKPFELPQSWEWARLSDLVNILNGRAYKKEELLSEGTPVLRVGNLFTSESWYYSNLELEENKYCNRGDLLFAWSASFGPFIWEGEKSIYHYHIWKLDFYAADLLYKRFLYTFLLEQTQKIKSSGHGVMMIHMTKEAMERLVVYLPPLAEQHRIVAKVDELMALCDQLEQQHSNAQEAHETLVSQLLATLTQSQNAEEFNANWQRIYAHFDVLFTTEASIDALKQTLLQLAVMGKLVPQDPNDEPASELLKRIQAEKVKLIAEGKLKKQKPLTPIGEDEKPFELPKGWEWVRLASTGITSTGGTPKTSDTHMFGGNIPFIGPGQISPAGELLEAEKYLTEDGIAQSTLAESGDILMVCIGGSIGKTLLVNERLTFNQQINCVKPVLVNSSYLNCMMNSINFQQELLLNATGSATPIINRSKWDELLVALAPLEEQHRIVAKVNALMALCDQLKTRIQQANQQQQAIADALVVQAVA